MEQCIASIYSSQFSFNFEIIVVDNASSDGSVEMLKREYPKIRLIQNKTNNLFAIANNQGAKLACGEYLLLLNSDTIVYDDNIEKICRYMDALDKSVICIGPKVLNADKTLQSQGFSGLTHWDTFTRHFKLDKFLPKFIARRILPPGTYHFNASIPHEVSWCVGACLLFRKKEYILVGGLNERLEFYGEEPEFGYRSAKKGYKTIYYPLAEIIHLGGKSTSKSAQSHLAKIRRYLLIVNETVGYKYAIGTSRITKYSYYLKMFNPTRRKYLKELIKWENVLIKALKLKKFAE